MKVLLFIDTETTGKLNFRAPLDHPGQPHLVQFAAITTDGDGEELSQYSGIVRMPVGIEIPAEASAIHGITTEHAEACGISPLTALNLLDDLATAAHTIIAHNVDFDCAVIGCSYARAGMKMNMYGGGLMTPAHFCTMKATTPICKLPGNYGDYKWPKLPEAYRHFFGCDFDKAHDALADVRACKRIYFEILMRQRGAGAEMEKSS